MLLCTLSLWTNLQISVKTLNCSFIHTLNGVRFVEEQLGFRSLERNCVEDIHRLLYTNMSECDLKWREIKAIRYQILCQNVRVVSMFYHCIIH